MNLHSVVGVSIGIPEVVDSPKTIDVRGRKKHEKRRGGARKSKLTVLTETYGQPSRPSIVPAQLAGEGTLLNNTHPDPKIQRSRMVITLDTTIGSKKLMNV